MELPFPSPEDLPKSGIKPTSPDLAGEFFTTESPGKPLLLFKSPSSWDFVTAALRDEYTDLSQEDEKELSKQAPSCQTRRASLPGRMAQELLGSILCSPHF